MAKLSRQRIFSGFLLLLAVFAFLVLWPARALHSENFVFYLPNQRRLIPIWTAGNIPYLPIMPVLELTGQLGMVVQKRSSIELVVGGVPLKLRRNQTKIEIGQSSITLQEPVLEANGQWLAPTSFLSAVLPSLPGGQLVYRPGTNRAFMGGVRPISFEVRLQSLPAGVRLVVSFTGPLSVQTAATNGQWVIFLGGAAIQPLEQDFFFQNPYLTKVRFDDQDGRPKLILTPSLTGLNFYPRLTDNGQTLMADVVSPNGPLGAAPVKAPQPRTSPALPRTPSGGPAMPQAPQPAPAVASIVLDAGHGGADSGARSEDGLLEKNVTAQLAGLADSDLSATKQYRVVLTRPGDSDPDFQQRTVTANTAHPIAFLSFHAGDLGDRTPVIAVYTYSPPSPPSAADPAPAGALFVPWNWAQAALEAKSTALAQDLQKDFEQIPGVGSVRILQAPVRQLRSINAPAVAIEIGSLAPGESAGQLAQPNFQKQVAGAVAAALQQFSAGPAKT